jgi:hypothetical protein
MEGPELSKVIGLAVSLLNVTVTTPLFVAIIRFERDEPHHRKSILNQVIRASDDMVAKTQQGLHCR